MMRYLVSLAIILTLLAPISSHAVNPSEVLKDPVLEERARNLSTKLRCLVCQNQSIDDSDAQLAKDLRVLVRERLVAGDTDKQVIDFLVARYGEFVLLQPRFAGHTLVLWLSPVVIFVLGVGFILLSRRRRMESDKLTSDEEAAIAKLLDKQEH